MDRKYRMYERRFLNRRGFYSSAFVLASVEDTSAGEGSEQHTPEVELRIGDCNRSISLEFDLYGADDRRNSLEKIDHLVFVLSAFRDALREEADLRDARQARRACSAPGEGATVPGDGSSEGGNDA